MKQAGEPMEKIVEYTRLTPEEVADLWARKVSSLDRNRIPIPISGMAYPALYFNQKAS